ncbi:hypothetical protein BJ508DRAFT_143571 [Ascobolus immersus RN42]|uniref:Uncharacterized protein n=1 Tax=Ascobolus immersus RN42 TaxID=1160509 RepID=A0A3N4I1K6_ASCIM|nr:hypothetical protein BJ508DRAFT_143571 [Ascobolus immersus RN42]
MYHGCLYLLVALQTHDSTGALPLALLHPKKPPITPSDRKPMRAAKSVQHIAAYETRCGGHSISSIYNTPIHRSRQANDDLRSYHIDILAA